MKSTRLVLLGIVAIVCQSYGNVIFNEGFSSGWDTRNEFVSGTFSGFYEYLELREVFDSSVASDVLQCTRTTLATGWGGYDAFYKIEAGASESFSDIIVNAHVYNLCTVNSSTFGSARITIAKDAGFTQDVLTVVTDNSKSGWWDLAIDTTGNSAYAEVSTIYVKFSFLVSKYVRNPASAAIDSLQVNATVIPEPSVLGILVIGGAVRLLRRRK